MMHHLPPDALTHNKKKRRSYARIAALVYLGLILCGALVLTLPVCSQSGRFTPFVDCLFTATSATCVTGLIVVDTATHWSLAGKIVILLLIQTGGMGFMAIVAMFAIAFGRRMGLVQRRLLSQSVGGEDASAAVLAKNLIGCTFACEGAGALLLCFRFIPRYGFGRGLFFSVFHAVSAFCNAGFDILPQNAPFASIVMYESDPLVNVTLMALITLGGLGFFAIGDIVKNRFHWKKFSLHTKLVLTVSAALTIVGAAFLWLFERDFAFAGLSSGQRFWAGLFQSVTARTAGFASVDLSHLSDPGSLVMDVLMLVGGSPASIAGGFKTTTFAILLLGIAAQAHRRNEVTVFHRRLDSESVTRAWTISAIYFFTVIIGTVAVSAAEPFGLKEALFEVCSAIGTVGLTMGVTPTLGLFSRVLLIVFMFAGKLGAMTLALALAETASGDDVQRPLGNVLIG